MNTFSREYRTQHALELNPYLNYIFDKGDLFFSKPKEGQKLIETFNYLPDNNIIKQLGYEHYEKTVDLLKDVDPKDKNKIKQILSGYVEKQIISNKDSLEYGLLGWKKSLGRMLFDSNIPSHINLGYAKFSPSLAESEILTGGNVNAVLPLYTIPKANSFESVAFRLDDNGEFVPHKVSVSNRNGIYQITNFGEAIETRISSRTTHPYTPNRKMSFTNTSGITRTINSTDSYFTQRMLTNYVVGANLDLFPTINVNEEQLKNWSENAIAGIEQAYKAVKINPQNSWRSNVQAMFNVTDHNFNLMQKGFTPQEGYLTVTFDQLDELLFKGNYNLGYTNYGQFQKIFAGITYPKDGKVTDAYFNKLKNSAFTFGLRYDPDSKQRLITSVSVFSPTGSMVNDETLSANLALYFNSEDTKINPSALLIKAKERMTNTVAYAPMEMRRIITGRNADGTPIFFETKNEYFNLFEHTNSEIIKSNILADNNRVPERNFRIAYNNFVNGNEDFYKTGKFVDDVSATPIYLPEYSEIKDILDGKAKGKGISVWRSPETNSSYSLKGGTINQHAMFKNAIDNFREQIRTEFIYREGLHNFGSISFNPEKEMATEYLNRLIGLKGVDAISKEQRVFIDRMMRATRSNVLVSAYTSGEKFMAINPVGKQTQNISGTYQMLEIPTSPLSFMNQPSQRRAQGTDILGSFYFDGIDFNKEIGEIFSSSSRLKHTGRNVIYEPMDDIYQSVYNNQINGFKLSDNIPKGFVKGRNNSVRGKALTVLSPNSFQDSYTWSSSLKNRGMYMADNTINFNIDLNEIDYSKITKIDGTNYTSFNEFIDDFYSLGKNKDNWLIDNSVEGNLLKNILGEDTYSRFVKNKSGSTTSQFKQLKDIYKHKFSEVSDDMELAETMNEFTEARNQFFEENFTKLTNAKGTVLNDNVVSTYADMKGAHFVSLEDISVSDSGLSFNVRKMIQTANGVKFDMDNSKGTVNTMTADLLRLNSGGKTTMVDALVNFKYASDKRGNAGSFFNALFLSMAEGAIDAGDREGFERFQREIMNAPIFSARGRDGKMVRFTPNQLFGYEMKLEGNELRVNNTYYKKATEEFIKQFTANKDFPNMSHERIARDLYLQNLEKLGINVSEFENKIFGSRFLYELKEVHDKFIEGFGDRAHLARVIVPVKDSYLEGSIKNANGTFEFTHMQDLSEGIKAGTTHDMPFMFLLNHNVNAQNDAITQKTASSLKVSGPGKTVFRKLGFENIVEALENKAFRQNQTLGAGIISFQEPNVHSVEEFLTYSFDRDSLPSFKHLDKGISFNQYQKGNYALSGLIKTTTKNNEMFVEPMMIRINKGSGIDRISKYNQMTSFISREAEETFALIGQEILDQNGMSGKFNYRPTEQTLKRIGYEIQNLITNGNSSDVKQYKNTIVDFVYKDIVNQMKNHKFSTREEIESSVNFLKRTIDTDEMKHVQNLLEGRIRLMDINDNLKLRPVFTSASELSKIYGNENTMDIIGIFNGNAVKDVFKNEEGTDVVSFFIPNLSLTDNGQIVYNESFFKANDYLYTLGEYKEIKQNQADFKKLGSLKDVREYFRNKITEEAEDLLDVTERTKLNEKYNVFKHLRQGLDLEINGNKISFSADAGDRYVEALVNFGLRKKIFTGIKSNRKEDRFVDFLNTQSKITSLNERGALMNMHEGSPNILITKRLNEVIEKHFDKINLDSGIKNSIDYLHVLEREYDLAKKTNDYDYANYLNEVNKRIRSGYLEGFSKDLKDFISGQGKYDDNTFRYLNEVKLSILEKETIFDEIENGGKTIERLENKLKYLAEAGIKDINLSVNRILEEGLDAKISQSIAGHPSEGSFFNNAFLNYLTSNNDNNRRSLFFKEGKLRNTDELWDLRKKYIRDLKKIYGENIDYVAQGSFITSMIKNIENGMSEEEVMQLLTEHKKSFSEELNRVIGITVVNEDTFRNKLGVKAKKGDVAYGFLTRHPTNFARSNQFERIVSLSDEEIKQSDVISQVFRTGGFDKHNDNTNVFLIGMRTMLGVDGDYDGDKIVLSLLSQADITNQKELQDTIMKIKNLNYIQNELSQGGNFYDKVNAVGYMSGGTSRMSSVLRRHGKSIGLKWNSEENVNLIKKDFLKQYKEQIYQINSFIKAIGYKQIDEVEGLEKMVNPDLQFKTSYGKIHHKIANDIYNRMVQSDAYRLSNLGNNLEKEGYSEAVQDIMNRINLDDYFEQNNIDEDTKNVIKKIFSDKQEFTKIFSPEGMNKLYKNNGTLLGGKILSEKDVAAYHGISLTGIVSDAITKERDMAIKFGINKNWKRLLEDENLKELQKIGLLTDYDQTIKAEDISQIIRILAGQEPSGDLVENIISSKHGTDISADEIIKANKNLFNYFKDDKKLPIKFTLKGLRRINSAFERMNDMFVEGNLGGWKSLDTKDLFLDMFESEEVYKNNIGKIIGTLVSIINPKATSQEISSFVNELVSEGTYVDGKSSRSVWDLAKLLGKELTEGPDLDGKTGATELIQSVSLINSAYLGAVATKVEEVTGSSMFSFKNDNKMDNLQKFIAINKAIKEGEFSPTTSGFIQMLNNLANRVTGNKIISDANNSEFLAKTGIKQLEKALLDMTETVEKLETENEKKTTVIAELLEKVENTHSSSNTIVENHLSNAKVSSVQQSLEDSQLTIKSVNSYDFEEPVRFGEQRKIDFTFNETEINPSVKNVQYDAGVVKFPQPDLFYDKQQQTVIDNYSMSEKQVSNTMNVTYDNIETNVVKNEMPVVNEPITHKKIKDNKGNSVIEEVVGNSAESKPIPISNYNPDIEETPPVETNVSKPTNIINDTKTNKTTAKKVVEEIKETTESVKADKVEDVIEELGETAKKTANSAEETIKKSSEAIKDNVENLQKALKTMEAKNKRILGISIGAGILGLFFNLFQSNRTVVHLEARDQINNPQNPNETVQKRLGNYKINTTVRDLF